MKDLNTLVKFILVSDLDDFGDFDDFSGLNSCVYVENGIVVSNKDYDEYVQIVKDFEIDNAD